MKKFPNLVYAIALRRLSHYELANSVGMSEWRFSRLLNGRADFAPHERKRVAEVLRFDQSWLFQQITPPSPRPDSDNSAAVDITWKKLRSHA